MKADELTAYIQRTGREDEPAVLHTNHHVCAHFRHKKNRLAGGSGWLSAVKAKDDGQRDTA